MNDTFANNLTLGDSYMTRPYWDIPRPVATARLAVELAADHGVGATHCLAGTGIDPAALEDPAATVAAAQELQLFRNLLAALGHDRGLGLELGHRIHPLAYGLWGFAILSSPTVGGAVDMGLRFLRLTSTYCRIRPAVTATDALLVVDDREVPADLRTFLAETTLSAIINMQYSLDRARVPVKELRIKGPAPAHAHRYEELYGVRPRFDQREHAVVIDVQCLLLALPQGNALTQRLCEEECRRLLQRRRRLAGLAGQVRDLLTRNPAQLPGMPAIAAELAMNPRTLRRRLADEGVDFSRLADEVRGTVAEELLTTTTLSLEEIASRLGYSEASAFTRAFKRWKGVAPRRYRQGPTP
ncbi:MAG: transcriptional regulator, AraC family [Moraxellaceae bacterium]|jgi:AraC-like DNA-binding protein|nr:transcriptional regulator, AraC family [Moraxellaceae bacterium]